MIVDVVTISTITVRPSLAYRDNTLWGYEREENVAFALCLVIRWLPPLFRIQ